MTSIIKKENYIYFGIRNNLTLYDKITYSNQKEYEITLNCDGVQLLKTSSKKFWIVSFSLFEEQQVFLLSVCIGKVKPSNIELLSDVIDELNKQRNIKLKNIVSDIPARSVIKGVVSHNSFYCCEYCKIKGQHKNNRMNYITNQRQMELRTNDEFRAGVYNQTHSKKCTPLTNLSYFDMVADFSLDYMHMICLGVVKKCMSIWLIPRSSSVKLTNHELINNMNLKLDLFNSCVTRRNFSRLCNSPITQFTQWKASQFRIFLLYYAPFVLMGNLEVSCLHNFLLLRKAMRMLLNESITNIQFEIVRDCLEKFHNNFIEFYGDTYSINIHNILHLANSGQRFHLEKNSEV
ncbi:hypothetical protein SNEBB_008635 [Seison nebaliae]|nr:hypothetical protein SNEBB_008635 [Seison nebaliae]